MGVGKSNLCLFPHFIFPLHIKFAWRLIRYVFLGADKRHVSGGGLEEVEVWVSLYGILFDSTWTTVDSKDGAEGVSGYDGTWVTGEWSGARRVNGASGRSGGMDGEGGGSGADGVNGETGKSGADGDNGERGKGAHVVEGIVWSSCLPIISS